MSNNYLDGTIIRQDGVGPYWGYKPSNVNKDARYTATADGSVRLRFVLDRRDYPLLTTDRHPELVEMVREAKTVAGDQPAGVFYLNGYGHLLVKAAGDTWFAGVYRRPLEFDFDGERIGAAAPPGLMPGDDWRGPHAVIKYVLTADGTDIRYAWSPRPDVIRRERLSEHGRGAAHLTSRIRQFKVRGGRIYVNEALEGFAPHYEYGELAYVYGRTW